LPVSLSFFVSLLLPFCFYMNMCLFCCVWVFCFFFTMIFLIPTQMQDCDGLCIMTIWVSVWELDSASIWHLEAFWMIVYKSSHGLSWELVWPILEALKATNFIHSILGYHIFDPYPSSIGAYLQS
jgi:hypothetical protein